MRACAFMKPFIFIALAILMLCGCQARTETPGTETPGLATEPDSIEAWADAYANALFDADGSLPQLIALIDVTHNGIPELFFAELGTANTWFTHGISYSGGKITDIIIPQEWMPTDLELYRDTASGDLVWIAGGTMRNGPGDYCHEWYTVDFSNLANVKQAHFFGWTERLDLSENAWRYFLDSDDGVNTYETVEETTLSEILNLQEQIFADYELMETGDTFKTITEDSLNHAALMDYFMDWSAQTNLSSPRNRMPVSETSG